MDISVKLTTIRSNSDELINDSFQLSEGESKTCSFNIEDINQVLKLILNISGESVLINSSQNIHYLTRPDNPLNRIEFNMTGRLTASFVIKKTGNHYFKLTCLNNHWSYTNANLTIVATKEFILTEDKQSGGFIFIYSLIPILLIIHIKKAKRRKQID